MPRKSTSTQPQSCLSRTHSISVQATVTHQVANRHRRHSSPSGAAHSIRFPAPPSTSSLQLHPPDPHKETDPYPYLVYSQFSYCSCPILRSRIATTIFARCTFCTTFSRHVPWAPLSCRSPYMHICVGTRQSDYHLGLGSEFFPS